ncbi:hypothetical protein AAHA92_02939 [Salvia divinorum]|uniref:Uncharacterized protein n=1 Tax=Salvia divinorum TaxID=28513 RepID=A0ABD1IFH3_SALDI
MNGGCIKKEGGITNLNPPPADFSSRIVAPPFWFFAAPAARPVRLPCSLRQRRRRLPTASSAHANAGGRLSLSDFRFCWPPCRRGTCPLPQSWFGNPTFNQIVNGVEIVWEQR